MFSLLINDDCNSKKKKKKIGFSTPEENGASNRISFCCLQIFCSLQKRYEKIHSFQCANFKKKSNFSWGSFSRIKNNEAFRLGYQLMSQEC